MGRTMRNIEPQIEQQCAFEYKLVTTFRDAHTVKHAFQRIAGEQQVEV